MQCQVFFSLKQNNKKKYTSLLSALRVDMFKDDELSSRVDV